MISRTKSGAVCNFLKILETKNEYAWMLKETCRYLSHYHVYILEILDIEMEKKDQMKTQCNPFTYI